MRVGLQSPSIREIRTLKRPDIAAEEIAALSALSPSQLRQAVGERGGTLRLETLACLVRRAQNEGSVGTELLETVLRQLLPRTRTIAKAAARGWVTDDDWRDVGQEAVITMVKDMARVDGDQLTYWEANFWDAFKADCIDALRALRRRPARGSVFIGDLPDGGGELEAPALDPIDQLTKREILGILTPHEAQAFDLVYFEKLQVRGGEGTVMHLMGKSREMIYKYLRSANVKIRADPRFEPWTGRKS